METIVIAGGTGLVGKQLTTMLVNKGYTVIVLTRNASTTKDDKVVYAFWNPNNLEMDASVLKEATAIINLAGANIAEKRWTAKRKVVLAQSRIKAGETIVHYLKNTPNKVHTVINASAQGWYGEDKESGVSTFTEDTPAANDFLGKMCKEWEKSISPVTLLGKRLVFIRTGLVMSEKGGALKAFLKPVKWGIAPVMNKGTQMQSWIHIDDICRLYITALDNKACTGAYNAAAPKPVTNKALITAIANAQKGSFYIKFPVPRWLLKIMLGDMSIELIKSVTLSAGKISDLGFQFVYPSIDAAMANLLSKKL